MAGDTRVELDLDKLAPRRCPICGKRTQFCGCHVICWDCGEMVFNEEKQVWEVRVFFDHIEKCAKEIASKPRKFYNAYYDGENPNKFMEGNQDE